MILELGLAALAIILLFVITSNGKPSNFPAGPRGLPVIGNLHQLSSEPYKRFMEMRKKYGDIFSLKFGSYKYKINMSLLLTFLDHPSILKYSLISQCGSFKQSQGHQRLLQRSCIQWPC